MTGDTALDLLQVLCQATATARKGRKLDNPTAWFAARLADGSWLEQSTGARECYQWIRSEIHLGRIKVTEGAAA